LYCPNDGVADHTATTRALAKAAQRHGAVIREHTQVIALERSGDRIAAVLTAEEERIEVGRTVVLLANTFVPEV
jgi:sarcosine oxidase subunit beta